MRHALRAAVRGVREPSHEERAELAGASPETQAYLSVRIAEAERGRPLTAREIAQMAQQTLAFGMALTEVARERMRLERQEDTGDNGLGFTLEEMAAEADARSSDADASGTCYRCGRQANDLQWDEGQKMSGVSTRRICGDCAAELKPAAAAGGSG
jgi:hypothetical protein